MNRAIERAVARRVAAIAEAADELPPGVTIEVGEQRWQLSGRGLARRWLTDPALRAFALIAARRMR